MRHWVQLYYALLTVKHSSNFYQLEIFCIDTTVTDGYIWADGAEENVLMCSFLPNKICMKI